MPFKIIKHGQWIIVEEDNQSNTLFGLIKGKVGIFHSKEGSIP